MEPGQQTASNASEDQKPLVHRRLRHRSVVAQQPGSQVVADNQDERDDKCKPPWTVDLTTEVRELQVRDLVEEHHAQQPEQQARLIRKNAGPEPSKPGGTSHTACTEGDCQPDSSEESCPPSCCICRLRNAGPVHRHKICKDREEDAHHVEGQHADLPRVAQHKRRIPEARCFLRVCGDKLRRNHDQHAICGAIEDAKVQDARVVLLPCCEEERQRTREPDDEALHPGVTSLKHRRDVH
mmetsp:Transcript_236/g.603  ORF Transcript_236/g.603 Transcript_236/m.603 type:complete len:239 (-) Transcript_236:490-1206(-)